MTWFSAANRRLYDSIGGSEEHPLYVQGVIAKFEERDTEWLRNYKSEKMLEKTRSFITHSPDALEAAIDYLRRSAEYIRENDELHGRGRTKPLATGLLPYLPLLTDIIDALETVLANARKGRPPPTKEPEVYNVERPRDKRLVLCH